MIKVFTDDLEKPKEEMVGKKINTFIERLTLRPFKTCNAHQQHYNVHIEENSLFFLIPLKVLTFSFKEPESIY